MQSEHHVEILTVKPGGTYKKTLGFKRLTVTRLCSSETCLKWLRQSKVVPNARCIPSYIFSLQKVNIQWKFIKKIVAVYCDIINQQKGTKWCHEFSEGRTDVHDEQRCGRSSLISDDLLYKHILIS
jgi:hypothetical protein